MYVYSLCTQEFVFLNSVVNLMQGQHAGPPPMHVARLVQICSKTAGKSQLFTASVSHTIGSRKV